MIKIKGTKANLEKFRAYFAGPPRIETVTIEDGDSGLAVTFKHEPFSQYTAPLFIKHVAEHFGCAAEIKKDSEG